MRILKPIAYYQTLHGVIANGLARQTVHPFYASFKLTSRCHFGCPFCNVKQNPTPDLSTETIKKILNNLSRSSVLMTSFEGGEPLLRSDIGELLRYARKHCNFYLLFTTSVKNIFDYPIAEFAPLIDFLHVSIDEGHNNLELFDLLPRLTKLPTHVSVQTVVTRSTIKALEPKVAACCDAGANIVVIPAAHMDNTPDFFPDLSELEQLMTTLRKKYPRTIHTPRGYFDAFKKGRCSTASIIIAPDGRLYYPCHIKGSYGPDLAQTNLVPWLNEAEASQLRREMKTCKRNCGWYQYYSIDSYTSITSIADAIAPLLPKLRRPKER